MNDSGVALLLVLMAMLACFGGALLLRRRKDPQQEINEMIQPAVDFDRDRIRLNDDTDPTSLMLTLSTRHGVSMMGWNNADDVWVFECGGSVFTGKTQLEALLKAKAVLG